MEKKTPEAEGYIALIKVFVLCSVCGYGWPLVRIYWPGYRLEILSNFILAHYTWQLVSSARTADFLRRIFPDGR